MKNNKKDKLDRFISLFWAKFRRSIKSGGKMRCPDEETLACYLDGLLEQREAEEIERHLLVCDDCLEQIKIISPAGEIEEKAFPEILSRLERRAGELVSGEHFIDLVLNFTRRAIEIIKNPGNIEVKAMYAPAVARGKKRGVFSDTICFSKKFDGILFGLEVENIGDGLGEVRVRILDGDPHFGKGLRASLFGFGRELASHVFEKSDIVFNNVGPGEYRIKFARRDREMGEISLNIIQKL